MKIALVLGTRPQIIKSALFIHSAKKDQINLEVIHTGQHYDYEMTKAFFEELNLPDPLANLNVGSGTHAQQTGRMILRLEKHLVKGNFDLVVVPGDTNSALAGALTAVAMDLPVAHIEAGARSYDWHMKEEVNRVLIDHCSTLLFTPTRHCTQNLLKEGIPKEKISEAGDTMYDLLLKQREKLLDTTSLVKLNLKPKIYAFLTLHRRENVDVPDNLRTIMGAIMALKFSVVFAIHPRTSMQLKKIKLYNKIKDQENVRILTPRGYHETLQLIRNARVVLTDSGGMQKEAFWLKTPCVTLRESTEWMETVELKANRLAGTKAEAILEATRMMANCKIGEVPNPFGDGNASEKILQAIKNYV
jgi:UDP-N-acetylglucosamine 2-epimerase